MFSQEVIQQALECTMVDVSLIAGELELSEVDAAIVMLSFAAYEHDRLKVEWTLGHWAAHLGEAGYLSAEKA